MEYRYKEEENLRIIIEKAYEYQKHYDASNLTISCYQIEAYIYETSDSTKINPSNINECSVYFDKNNLPYKLTFGESKVEKDGDILVGTTPIIKEANIQDIQEILNIKIDNEQNVDMLLIILFPLLLFFIFLIINLKSSNKKL